MSLRLLTGVAMHRYYRHYGIRVEHEKALFVFPLLHVLGITELLAKATLEREFTDEELVHVNHLAEPAGDEKSDPFFSQDEELRYHHTYEEERRLLDYVRKGNVERALWHSKHIDLELGTLSGKEMNHWKNASVAAITLATRAAIEGGLPPSTAYRLSDHYIQSCDGCTDIEQVLACRNRAVEELTDRVRQRQLSRSRSGYVERCKDYVGSHYREKIYQADIAEKMGISASYLSRLFKRETGMKLQDYIVQVRLKHAADLLKYSNESIANIAEYVNFPSQSYMGRMFKAYLHMSPGQYRQSRRPDDQLNF